MRIVFTWSKGTLFSVFIGAWLLIPVLGAAAAEQPQGDAGGIGNESYIEYQLRPNEDPSKVARMFHVTVEDLLALNKISDPRRLTVGATLKIPDPRATLVQQLRAEKKAGETQLATAEANLETVQKKVTALEGELADLREANDELQGQQRLYHVLRAAVIISGGTAIVLALAGFVAWAKSRDAERRGEAALRKTEVLQAALEKYRQLSAQFELRYQSLFHQVGTPSPAHARAQALRTAYDEDRARLDAIVSEAEREITGAVAELVRPRRRLRAAKGGLTPVPAARKSG